MIIPDTDPYGTDVPDVSERYDLGQRGRLLHQHHSAVLVEKLPDITIASPENCRLWSRWNCHSSLGGERSTVIQWVGMVRWRLERTRPMAIKVWVFGIDAPEMGWQLIGRPVARCAARGLGNIVAIRFVCRC